MASDETSDSTFRGGCQCGQLRYAITEPPLRLNVCFCTDCQRQSGSAFGMSLVVKPASFVIEQGEVKEFELKADSGRIKTCGFCPDCGVRIYNQTSALCSIKAGTLDDTRNLRPDALYWSRSKQSWLSLEAGVPEYLTHE